MATEAFLDLADCYGVLPKGQEKRRYYGGLDHRDRNNNPAIPSVPAASQMVKVLMAASGISFSSTRISFRSAPG
jgi:hypothetical protein